MEFSDVIFVTDIGRDSCKFSVDNREFVAVIMLLYNMQQLLFSQVRKRHIHTRVTGLPVCPELTRDTLPKSSDVGCFLSISGVASLSSLSLNITILHCVPKK